MKTIAETSIELSKSGIKHVIKSNKILIKSAILEKPRIKIGDRLTIYTDAKKNNIIKIGVISLPKKNFAGDWELKIIEPDGKRSIAYYKKSKWYLR